MYIINKSNLDTTHANLRCFETYSTQQNTQTYQNVHIYFVFAKILLTLPKKPTASTSFPHSTQIKYKYNKAFQDTYLVNGYSINSQYYLLISCCINFNQYPSCC